MKWSDITEQIMKGTININDDVIVYNQETGDELDCDLIQFEDNGQICIVINSDDDEEDEEA